MLELFIEEGKRFKKGEVLAILDRTPYEAEVNDARASLEAAGLLDAEAAPDAAPATAYAAMVARTADVLEAWAHGDGKRLDVAQAACDARMHGALFMHILTEGRLHRMDSVCTLHKS